MIIGSFGGIIPRLAEHMLAINQATIAHDVNLRNGQLEAWREPCQFGEASSNAKSIYLYGCCLLHWPDLVNCAELTPDWGRLYITGREGNGLEAIIVNCDCSTEYIKTGVPAPAGPPSASGPEQCSRDASARSYVYTYVTEWGEESPPSPPSNVIRVNDGDSVTVSGITPVTDPAYHVVAINIYRTASGFRIPDGKVQEMKTDYQLVAVISPTQTTYSDKVKGVGLGPVLETQYDRPPPMMAGITSIGDQVRLAGYSCNRIYMSEPFQPHNWPAKYDLTLDYNIVHMLNQDQRLFVTTDSIPYIIDVSGCDDTKCTPVTSFELPLPDIGCHYSHGAIMTHHGMIYATPFGIVLIQPNAEWHILTAKWFGEKEWLKLRPDTIRMAYWEGYLFFATDMATFLLNINGRPYGDMDGAELVTLSDKPIDLLVSNTGKLLFLEDGKVWEWDGGIEYRPYIWQSRQITAMSLSGRSEMELSMSRAAIPKSIPYRDVMWWPTAIRLRGAAKATIYDSRGHAFYSQEIANEQPHRLPRHGRHMWYRMRLSGISQVEFVSLGTSLSSVNAGE